MNSTKELNAFISVISQEDAINQARESEKRIQTSKHYIIPFFYLVIKTNLFFFFGIKWDSHYKRDKRNLLQVD